MHKDITVDKIIEILSQVKDPEIRLPITQLKMVDKIDIFDSRIYLKILLTIPECPLQDKILGLIYNAFSDNGYPLNKEELEVEFGYMSKDQLSKLKLELKGGRDVKLQIQDKTAIYNICSAKGGVGKSTITAYLAALIASMGYSVGILDADIYGYSIPKLFNIENQSPTKVNGMIMPLESNGVYIISSGLFVQGNQPILWRGPILHRALEQFLSDVYWGNLDILLIDSPPGTGDVAISIAQLLNKSKIIVVTTPQIQAYEVAERTGIMTNKTGQHILGVIENMSGYLCEYCHKHSNIFGNGGGETLVNKFNKMFQYKIKMLGNIPLNMQLSNNLSVISNIRKSFIYNIFISIVDNILKDCNLAPK